MAIITTHPIQYNAPWFKLLTERNNIEVKVFYTWSQSETGLKFDPGFKRNIEWDIPLLEGYAYEFVPNIAKQPGTRNYSGIKNPALIGRIKEFSPDTILVNGWNFDSHLKCIRFFYKKIPVLFRGDSTLLDEKKGVRTLLRRTVLKWVFSHVDYAFYVGEKNKQYFLKHGFSEKQLFHTPHAIDNRRYGPREEYDIKASELRNRLGIKKDEIVLLFAGKFENKKDPALLIEAFKNVTQPDLNLVMVGNGELEIELKKQGSELSKLFFMDFQNQQMMPVIYTMANIFILPSKGPGETWGLAVNEAMAACRPVIVSNKCGCAVDLVEEGINGYVFPAGDSTALEKYINTLYSRKGELKEMGKISERKIASFSFDHITVAIENLVNKIVKDKG